MRGDHGAIALLRSRLGLENKIVDLILDRLDLYRWINQSSGTNYLFAEDASCLVHLPRDGGSRHADRLRPHHVPFIEAQGAIVDAAWQAEPIFSDRNQIGRASCRERVCKYV